MDSVETWDEEDDAEDEEEELDFLGVECREEESLRESQSFTHPSAPPDQK